MLPLSPLIGKRVSVRVVWLQFFSCNGMGTATVATKSSIQYSNHFDVSGHMQCNASTPCLKKN